MPGNALPFIIDRSTADILAASIVSLYAEPQRKYSRESMDGCRLKTGGTSMSETIGRLCRQQFHSVAFIDNLVLMKYFVM